VTARARGTRHPGGGGGGGGRGGAAVVGGGGWEGGGGQKRQGLRAGLRGVEGDGVGFTKRCAHGWGWGAHGCVPRESDTSERTHKSSFHPNPAFAPALCCRPSLTPSFFSLSRSIYLFLFLSSPRAEPLSVLGLKGCTASVGNGEGTPATGVPGEEGYKAEVEGNGEDDDCFILHMPEGDVVHRCRGDTPAEANAEAKEWVRLFNESPAIHGPSKKLLAKLSKSFSSKAISAVSSSDDELRAAWAGACEAEGSADGLSKKGFKRIVVDLLIRCARVHDADFVRVLLCAGVPGVGTANICVGVLCVCVCAWGAKLAALCERVRRTGDFSQRLFAPTTAHAHVRTMQHGQGDGASGGRRAGRAVRAGGRGRQWHGGRGRVR